MQTAALAYVGPTPWQLPALAAVVSAAALSLACCALVLFAPDQHSVRRLMRRALPLAATAGVLVLLSALVHRAVPFSARGDPTGTPRLALDLLLLGGWYVLALTALVLGRAYALVAGGPLRMRPTARAAAIASFIPRTAAPSAADTTTFRPLGRWPLLLAVLTAASLALPLVAPGSAAGASSSNGLGPDVATALLLLAANAAAALAAQILAPNVPRVSHALLAAFAHATVLSLLFNLSLLLAR